MSRRATQLLSDLCPELASPQYEPEIEQGAINEDSPSWRGCLHFFNPITRQGLHFGVLGNAVFNMPSAWATALTGLPVPIESDWWDKAIRDYKGGSRTVAYTELGRAIHILTQDMGQPYHVHNDPHSPHTFDVPYLGPIGVPGDDAPYEDFAKNNEGQPPFTSATGSIDLATPRDYSDQLSIQTYNVSRFPVTSSGIDPDGISFVIIQVGQNSLTAKFELAGDPDVSDPSLRQISNYKIELPIGLPIFYFPSITINGEDGGPDFHFSNDFWPIPEQTNSYYFDRSNLVTTSGGTNTLDQYYLDRTITPSIEYSAGLVKLFARNVDNKSPILSLTDANGGISDGTVTNTVGINFVATDPADSAHPTASGIYRVELDVAGGTHQNFPFTGLPSGRTGPHVVNGSFSGLAEGAFTMRAYDGLGNVSDDFEFAIDRTPPAIGLITGGTSAAPNVVVPAVDPNGSNGTAPSGIMQVDIYDSITGNWLRSIGSNGVGGLANFTATFSGLADGAYDVVAEDFAFNDSPLKTFSICTNPNGCSGQPPTPPLPPGGGQPPGLPPGGGGGGGPSPCQGLSTAVCQQFCQSNAAICTNRCQQDPTDPACQIGCNLFPSLCQNNCTTAPYPSYCNICLTQPSVCQPNGSGSGGGCSRPFTTNLLPGFACHGTVSERICAICPGVPVYVNGFQLSRSGQACEIITTQGVSAGGVQASVCVNSPYFCKTVDLTAGLCSGDPSFVGGDLSNQPLPQPSTDAVIAFSPGIPNSPHPMYVQSYQATYSTSSVTVLIRNASGALVRTLSSGTQVVFGPQSFTWEGKNDQGILQPEGIYTWYLIQNNLYNPAQYSQLAGKVAIDNTLPVANFSPISIFQSDLNLLQLNGSAADANFSAYAVEYAAGLGGPWTLIQNSNQPLNGALGILNAASIVPGIYVARLTVIDTAGLVSIATEAVTVAGITGSGVRLVMGSINQTVSNPASTISSKSDNPNALVDEAMPAGGAGGTAPNFNWAFVSTTVYSGTVSHTDTFADNQPGTRLHYFIQASSGMVLQTGDNIVQYVYLNPANPPTEILLGFYTGQGDGEHRLYWGPNSIQTGGVSGSPSLYSMGALPQIGQWLRLKIPASLVGLEGRSITGVVYGAYGGRAYWDKTTNSHPSQELQSLPVIISTPPANTAGSNTGQPYTLLKPANLKVDVYRTTGQVLVKNLFTGLQSSGTHTVAWDQKDAFGNLAPEGNYFLRFTSPDGPIDSEAIVLGSTVPTTGTFQPSAADADANRYAVQTSSGQIGKTTAAGYSLTTFGAGQLNSPSGLLMDTSGYIVVRDAAGAKRFEVGRVDFPATTLTAQIQVPAEQALVKATVPIIGLAYGHNFASYKVELAPTWNPSSYTVLNQGFSPVADFNLPITQQTVYGNLATWETGLVPIEEYPATDLFHPPTDLGYKGRWTLRLTATGTDGASRTAISHVMIGRVINNGTGGLIVSDDGRAEIKVPALSIQNDWDIFGLITATNTLPAQMPPMPAGLAPVSKVYQLIPGGYTFLKPVTFQIALSTGVAVDPANVGFYSYDAQTGSWDRLGTTRQSVTDSSGTIVGTLFINDRFTQVPNFDGYYGLFTSTITPRAPVLNPIPSPTPSLETFVTGVAQPFSRITLVLLQAPTSFVTPTFATNGDGGFAGTVFLPVPGAYQLGATATDFYGNTSATSTPVAVTVTTSAPSSITSISFMDSSFSTAPVGGALLRNGPVYIQMRAADIDPSRQDTAYALLTSSSTDPRGILVPLLQVSVSSPVYQGTAYLGGTSDPSTLTLSAQVNGEIITATAQSSASVHASLAIQDPVSGNAPFVFSRTHPSVFQDTFENGLDQWATFNAQNGATVVLDTTSVSSGQASVKLMQLSGNGDFSTLLTQTPFDARKYPVMEFDYRLDAAHVPSFNLYFRYKGSLHEVRLTGRRIDLPPGYLHMGDIGIVADGAWHTAQINLYGMFANLYPGTTTFPVDQVILGGWQQELYFGIAPIQVSSGSFINLDNVRLWSGGVSSRNPVLQWAPPSLGASLYRYTLDTASATIPSSGVVTSARQAFFTGLADGRYYFHIQAQKADGTWGAADHYLLQVDGTAPTISDPSPPSAVPFTRTSTIRPTLHVTDANGIDLTTLRFTVNNASYTAANGGVSYAADGTLAIQLPALTPPVIIQDGEIVTVSITDVADMAGNHIVQPFTWSWQAALSSLGSSQLSPATFNGGQEPAWSPNGTRLAFSSNRSGFYNLYLMSSQAGTGALFESTSTLTQLTSSAANLTQPAWSPDGTRIAFVSDASGSKQIWVMPAAGGIAIRLTTGDLTDEHPMFSPDGLHILFSRSVPGIGNLWSVDLNASGTKTGEHQITHDDIGFDLEPRWSGDGQTITYRRSLYVDNINVVHADGTGATTLTSSGKDITPVYNSDGSRIVFASARGGTVPGLWVMDAQGQSQSSLLDNLGLYSESQPAWSQSGDRIAFTSTRSGSSNVWILGLLNVSSMTVAPAYFSPAGPSAGAKKTATIHWNLSASGATVNLDVLNGGPQGNNVRQLVVSEIETAGDHSVVWDGVDASSHAVADGIYTVRLTVTGQAASNPIISLINVTAVSSAPAVSLQASSGDSARSFFNLSSTFSIVAQGSVGTPIAQVDLAIDTTNQFHVYAGTFTLPVGPHLLAFRATDVAGNISSTTVQAANIDNAAPVSSITYQGVSFPAAGAVYVSSNTTFLITAIESSSAAVISGVSQLSAALDGATVVVQSSQVALGAIGALEGAHALSFNAQDDAGNVEPLHNVAVFVDTTPPVTSISIGTATVISTFTVIRLSAIDPLASGIASGVNQTFYSRDGSPFVVYLSSFVFVSTGTHTVQYFSVDQVGNTEAVRASTVTIGSQVVVSSDTLAPVTRIVFSSTPTVNGGQTFISTSTRVGFVAVDTGSGVAFMQYRVDGSTASPFQTFTSSFTVAAGTHTIAFRSQDNAGNLEVAKSSTVIVQAVVVAPTDKLAPITRIVFSSTPTISGGQTFISTSTRVGFVAVDTGSGVAFTQYRIDGSTATPFQTFTSSFTVTAGTHTINFRSQDNAGNLEVAKSSTVVVQVVTSTPTSTDKLAPVTRIVFNPQALVNAGKSYISASTKASFVAVDTGTGVAFTQYRIDGSTASAFQTFTSSFTLTEGTHTVTYRSQDKAGNLEVARSSSVVVDTRPPVCLLIKPSPTARGLGIVYAQGTLKIIGTINDANLKNWVLDAAPGAIITFGFKTLQTGTVNVSSGMLATWNTHSLLGFYTVRLTATDVIGQKTVSQAIVFIGPPALLSILIPGNSASAASVLAQSSNLRVSDAGDVIIQSQTTARAVRFDNQGRFLDDSSLSSLSQDDRLSHTAVRDADGNTYRINAGEAIIRKTDATGEEVLSFGPDFGLKSPVALALGDSGTLYVLDRGKQQVLKFGLPGDIAQTQIIRLGGGTGSGGVYGGGQLNPLSGAARVGLVDSTFVFHEVFVFPNPAKGGAVPTIHIETGVADRVTVKIYNVAGQEIQEADVATAPTIIDSGKGPQYAYEYAWTGHIASGIYFYVVDAQKNGSHMTKSGKFAVVR